MTYLPIPPIERGDKEIFLYFTNREGLPFHMEFITGNPIGNFRATSIDKIVITPYNKISDTSYYKDLEIKEAILKFIPSFEVDSDEGVYLIETYIHKSKKTMKSSHKSANY